VLPKWRYVIFQFNHTLEFVEMPYSYAYQLTALNRRLHKELAKLTATEIPTLPTAIAECNELEIVEQNLEIINGLVYLNQLKRTFASINETTYPLVSLLTEIRALQAQLEQWYEEDQEGLHD